LHVEDAFVPLDEGTLEVEGLVVDVEPDDLAVGNVDDRLAVPGEAECRLTIGMGQDS
jgi:hypothetical protein